jgi:hypothetical protein
MIDAQSGVAGPGISEVVPKGINPLVRVQRSQSIGPALRDKTPEGLPYFGTEQRIVGPAFRFVHVEISGHDIEIASQHGRGASCKELGRMSRKPIQPSKFIREFWARRWIAVGKVKAADKQAADCGFYIPTMGIVRIARERTAYLSKFCATGQDGDTVPALLTVPYGAVTRVTQRGFGKFLLGSLKLLETDDFGPSVVEPFEQHGQATIDAIHVEGGDLHVTMSRLRPMALGILLLISLLLVTEQLTIGSAETRPVKLAARAVSRSSLGM